MIKLICMYIGFFKIGNIKIKLEVFDSKLIRERMSAYACSSFNDPDATIIIEEKDVITREKNYQLISAHSYRGYAVSDTEYVIIDKLDSPENLSAVLYISKDCTKVRGYVKNIENLGGASNEIRAFNMIGEAFKYIALNNNGFVFHASTIAYNEKGVLFSADSGTGKSTHTGLWMKYYPKETEMINDDSPLIQLIDGKPYVFGTPWSGKTDINNNICVPLYAIVFLKRALTNSITEIEFCDAFKLFMAQAFIVPYAPVFLSFTTTADKVLKQIKMTILNCNISKNAVDTVKEYLEEKYDN